jgi:hypothetical protein
MSKSRAMQAETHPVKSQQLPHKAAFALTSRGNDFYSAMTRVAVASLRVSNPKLHVAVACDRDTDDSIRQAGDSLIREVDEWLVVDTNPGDAGYRNRFVKTKLRLLIDGPFLFLDSDVFVRGDLCEIFSLDCDIAGARNHSRDTIAEQIWAQDNATLEAMGWKIGDNVYINGGVLYYNDTEGARSFATEWHRRWSESSNSGNYHRDQPALNSALDAVRPKLLVLPHRFNAQVKATPGVAADAVIWHYYASTESRSMKQYDDLVGRVLRDKEIDFDEIRGMVGRTLPWLVEDVVDILAESEVLRNKLLSSQSELSRLNTELSSAKQTIEAIFASKSWAITKPLRLIDAVIGRLFSRP